MDEPNATSPQTPASDPYVQEPRILRPSNVALTFALLGLVAFAAAKALHAPETILEFSQGADLKKLSLDPKHLLGVLLFVAWVPLCVVFSAGLGIWAMVKAHEEPLHAGDRIALLFVLGTVVVLGIHFGKESKEWSAAYRARVAAANPSGTTPE